METLNPFKDGTPFHPALVHVPIGAAMFVPLLAFLFIVAIQKKWLTPKIWWVVVIAQLVAVLGGIMSYNSGEFAKDMVVGVVPDSPVEEHEKLAQYFMIGLSISTVISLAAAFVKAEKAALGLRVLTLLLSLGVMAVSAKAGHAGGRLIYIHYAGDAYGPRSEGDTSFCDDQNGDKKDGDKKDGDKKDGDKKGDKKDDKDDDDK